MKKLIALSLFSLISYAQNDHYGMEQYVSITTDVRNATIGSNATNNKSELDVTFRAGVISNENLTIGILYENFNSLDFRKYAFEIGQRIGKGRLQFTPTIEAGWIERFKLNHWTVGANLHTVYYLNDNFGILLTTNVSWRTDLNYNYGGNNWKLSNGLGMIYTFNK
jgi:hypothetical protein